MAKKLTLVTPDEKARAVAFKPVPESDAKMEHMYALVVARFALLYQTARIVARWAETRGQKEDAAELDQMLRNCADLERSMPQ
jgi:hypothetical protein